MALTSPRIETSLLALLDEVNAARRRGATLSPAEVQLERAWGASARLAVYGSLAPGRENHHLVAHLGGDWTAGLNVRGERHDRGWGTGLGYPALKLMNDGPAVDVQLLVSPDLRASWEMLDAFEGPEYVRVLVPVFRGTELLAVANLYEATASG